MADVFFNEKSQVLEGNNNLHTKRLPKYNCSNCEYFNKKVEILKSKLQNGINGTYAFECSNFVHPLENCVLKGFAGHSAQFEEDFEKYNG